MLKKSFLTQNLNPLDIKVIADAMYKKSYNRGDTIIKYGDMGSEYYILSSGFVEVYVYQPGTKADDPNINENVMLTKHLGPGTGFGEIALLYNDKRTATIKASEDNIQVWVLEGRVFKNIIIKQSISRRNIELGFLEKVPLLQNLEKYDKMKLIDGLEVKYYAKGQPIVVEGEEGNYFYIIEDVRSIIE